MDSKYWNYENNRKLTTSTYQQRNFPESFLQSNSILKITNPIRNVLKGSYQMKNQAISHLFSNNYSNRSVFRCNHSKSNMKRFSKIDASQSNFEIKPQKNFPKSLSVSNIEMLKKNQHQTSNELEKKLFKFKKDDPAKILFQKSTKILKIKDTRPESLIIEYFNEIKTDVVQKYCAVLDKVNSKENEMVVKIKDHLLKEIKIATEACLISLNALQREKLISLISYLRDICERISGDKVNDFEISLIEDDFLKEFELFKSDILLNKSMFFIKYKTKGYENEIKKDTFLSQPFYFGTMIMADFYLSTFDIFLVNKINEEKSQSNILNSPLLHYFELAGNMFESSKKNYIIEIKASILNDFLKNPALDLNNFNINELDERTFYCFKELHSINISNNCLEYLSPRTFLNKNELYNLDLSCNLLKEIPSDLFQPLVALQNLRLDGNIIEKIEDNAFESLKELKNLDLSGNLIKNVEKHTFYGLFKLLSLNLSENEIDKIHPEAFKSLEKLKTIKIESNKLETLIKNVFKISSNFSKLDLTNNKITDICLSIDTDENTETQNNAIDTDRKASFLWSKIFLAKRNNFFSYLTNLNLSSNKLKVIDEQSFTEMNQLIMLNLSCNEIELIQPLAFKNLNKIKLINLTDNFLNRYELFQFKGIRTFCTIDLSRNEMSTENEMIFKKKANDYRLEVVIKSFMK